MASAPNEEEIAAYETNKEYETDTSRACWKLRYGLKKCIVESDCINIDKWSAKECMSNPSSRITESCRNLVYSYNQCRKSMLDMRTRFRGIKD